jgi:ABC-2 type transport system ATP-binding protein
MVDGSIWNSEVTQVLLALDGRPRERRQRPTEFRTAQLPPIFSFPLATVRSFQMDSSDRSTFEVSNLRVVRNGSEILKSISFHAAPGELIGLLGPSGSGKSTLMRSLLGVQAITGGSARIMESVAGSPLLRGRLGYMAQSSAVYLDLTVEENVRYFAGVLAQPLSEVARVIDVVALTSFSHRLVSSLSGGERARVSLGVALLGSPPALILDEPTVGLDPILRRDLWRTFENLARTGATVIVSSHVMDEAARCARLLLLREGTLLFDGTPASLLAASEASGYDEAFERLIEGSP